MPETVRAKVGEFPQYMEQGSKGPAVNLVLTALMVWAAIGGQKNHKIVLDCDYGEIGVVWMKEFQKQYGLEQDGGFGPTTRAKFDEVFGFKFEDAARACGLPSQFVQLDGSSILWDPREH